MAGAFRASAAALVLAVCAQGAAAQMYRCVDARGVTHYADQPTPGCANTEVDIHGSPPVSGNLAPAAPSAAQQEADFRRRQMDREQAESRAAAQRAQLVRRCASFKEEQAVLSSGRRLVTFDARGERAYVDDAVRDRRLAELQAELKSCP